MLREPYVPHSKLEPGYYYIRVNYHPGYAIVALAIFPEGKYAGKLGVWSIDEEGYNWPADFEVDQFIEKVPEPLRKRTP